MCWEPLKSWRCLSMIKSKEDLKYYLECDRVALFQTRKHPKLFGDLIWKYEIILRKREYYENCKSRYNPIYLFYRIMFSNMSLKLGYSIPLNVCGPGLSIAHIGTIIINSHSKIGANCRIQTGVTLGSTNGLDDAPQLGDNIFLGEGCKLIGGINVASGVQIGANAVVVKDISEQNTTWAGIPAKKISSNSSINNLIVATDYVKRKTGNKK